MTQKMAFTRGAAISIPPPASPLLPDERGFFGEFGGCFVPEILMPNMQELAQAFGELREDPTFWQEYTDELTLFSGRPTPITYAQRLSQKNGGAQIFLKREDLNQTGAHKVNNVIGQGILAKRLGKKRVIAETGAGQHGVATATMAARFGFEATIYMGAEDVERQRPNVFWMERMGATVVPVESGTRTLKDAINEALRDWSANVESTHYLLGTACGPHPFPALVAYLQSVAGIEAQLQMQALGVEPKKVFACLGGGSNALGIFQGFLRDPKVTCVGVEAGGKGVTSGAHAARIDGGQGTKGIAQGYATLFLQTKEGQMLDTHSVSAGLDYVGVSPVIADLYTKKQVAIESATDDEVLDAAKALMQTEGLIPALESAHGIAAGLRAARKMPEDDAILINLSGRGDKDIFTFASAFGDESWTRFLEMKVGEAQEKRS